MEPIPETGVMTDTGVAVICGHRLLSEAICEELAEFTDLRAVAADSYLDDIDELVATQHPDVLVLDGCLTRAHGRAALGRFHLSRSSPAVVLLSDHDDPEEIDAAVKWGAQAVVLKIPPPKELADAIRYSARGDMWLSPPLLTDVLASDRNAEGPGARATDMELSSLGAPETLSLGERAVIDLLVEEADAGLIASALALSIQEANRYLRQIHHKLRSAAAPFLSVHGADGHEPFDPKEHR